MELSVYDASARAGQAYPRLLAAGLPEYHATRLAELPHIWVDPYQAAEGYRAFLAGLCRLGDEAEEASFYLTRSVATNDAYLPQHVWRETQAYCHMACFPGLPEPIRARLALRPETWDSPYGAADHFYRYSCAHPEYLQAEDQLAALMVGGMRMPHPMAVEIVNFLGDWSAADYARAAPPWAHRFEEERPRPTAEEAGQFWHALYLLAAAPEDWGQPCLLDDYLGLVRDSRP